MAEVSSTGLVTAKSNGVATITARVSINGKTVSGSFPVKVMPNLNLASLTVAGKNVLKAGNNAYRACTRCSYTENYTYLPATGHGTYSQDASKSGQTEDGTLKWTAYSCPNGCGDYYMKLTVKALDGNGNPISGASVKITDNSGKVNISGTTDGNGTFSPSDSLKPGAYTFTLSNGKDKQTANITLSNGKASGSIGRVGSGSSSEPGSSSGSGSGSSSGSSGNRCPLCNWNDSMHNKPVVGVFVYVIHAILHFFFRLFNR